MSRTHIRPDHIGEPLVSALVRQLKEDGRLDQLKCRNILDGTEADFEQVLKGTAVGTEFTAYDNVPLTPLHVENVEFGFDGMSQVDCVIQGNSSFGIEIKLGTTRMAGAEFTRRFCSPCGYTAHTPPRICGSMIAVLDGRFQQDALRNVPLSVEIAEGVSSPLVRPWGLIVRRQVLTSWTRTTPPTFIRPCWVIAFEEFVPAVGGPSRFNELVLKLVGDDFVGAWGLS